MNQKNLDKIKLIRLALQSVIKGKEVAIDEILCAIFANGHILINDIPGVGKTTLAMSISKVMNLNYKRVQFTPDVLPSDIIGFTVMNQDGEFEYRDGAVLCNLFLADEINRTSPKTQSALLEVMEEGKVTVDSITRSVPQPFVVIATQNPIGSIGTQLLPDSQLDRFMIQVTLGYPDKNAELQMLEERYNLNPMVQLKSIIDEEDLIDIQDEVSKVFIQREIYEYIIALVNETRNRQEIRIGVSPRGTIAITKMSRARAYMQGRDFVLPEDVIHVFKSVVAHRIILKTNTKISHTDTNSLIQDIIHSINTPKL